MKVEIKNTPQRVVPTDDHQDIPRRTLRWSRERACVVRLLAGLSQNYQRNQ